MRPHLIILPQSTTKKKKFFFKELKLLIQNLTTHEKCVKRTIMSQNKHAFLFYVTNTITITIVMR